MIAIATIMVTMQKKINGLDSPTPETNGTMGTIQSDTLLNVWNRAAISILPFVLLYSQVKITVKKIVRRINQKAIGVRLCQFCGWKCHKAQSTPRIRLDVSAL